MQEKRAINQIIDRLVFIILALVLITTYLVFGVFAKYKSIAAGNTEARVAKFGSLNLYEYNSSGDIITTGTSTQTEEIIITPGKDINKKIIINYSGNEVATYLFFVVNSDGWKITKDKITNNHVMSINNNKNEYLAKWEMKNHWTHLESLSTETRNIFYFIVPPHSNINETVMEKIEVNAVDLDSDNPMDEFGYELSFEVYAASALDITPEYAYARAEANH